MDRSVIADAISEICRARSVSHIIISPDVFEAYNTAITAQHVRSGIRRGTCHSVGILILDGLRDDMVFTFNYRRAKAARTLLRLVREEKYDQALSLIDSILDRGSKWIHTDQAPGFPSEGDDEGETTGELTGDK